MHKVALVAGPGAGKTTLANALTAKLKSMGKNWYNVSEAAREYIDQWGPEEVQRPVASLIIANKQKNKEDAVNLKADGFVTDSPIILPWHYARGCKFNSAAERYEVLTALYKMFIHAFNQYTLIVNVMREKEYVQDGCRTQTEEEARAVDTIVADQVRQHGFEMLTVSGTTDERVQQIVEKLYGAVPSTRRKQSPR